MNQKVHEDENALLGIYVGAAEDAGFFEHVGLPRDASWGAFRQRYSKGPHADAERAFGACPSSKQMGLLSVFHKGGSGSSLFDVKPLGVDGSSGGFGWSVF